MLARQQRAGLDAVDRTRTQFHRQRRAACEALGAVRFSPTFALWDFCRLTVGSAMLGDRQRTQACTTRRMSIGDYGAGVGSAVQAVPMRWKPARA